MIDVVELQALFDLYLDLNPSLRGGDLKEFMRWYSERYERERRKREGCGKKLADGQWYTRCGARDIGGFVAICTECGGEYRLASSL